jgi:hypothetical protein
MFDFLKSIGARREKAATTAQARYRQLITSAAADGELDTKEAAELDKLAIDLSVTLDTVHQHIEAERERIKLAPTAAKFEQTEAALQDAHAPVKRFDLETKRLDDEHRLRMQHRQTVDRDRIKVAYKAAIASHEPAVAARDRIAQIERDNWQLYGGVSPEEAQRIARATAEAAQRRRHLVRGITGQIPEDLVTRVDVFEVVMTSDRQDGVDYVPLKDQDVADFNLMLSALPMAGGGRVRYLRERGKQYPQLEPVGRRLVEMFENLMATNGGFDPDSRAFIPCPGQTQAELDEMLTKLRTAWREASTRSDWRARALTV